MSKELTEQWQNGTLPLNHYYVKTKSGRYGINHTVLSFDGDKPRTKLEYSEHTEEVLEPVPSYSEHQELKEYMYYLIHNRTELTNQITKHLDRIEQLEKKLEIAVKALNIVYHDMKCWTFISKRDRRVLSVICDALKEMEGVK